MIEAFRSADAQKSKLGDPLYEDLTKVSSARLMDSLGLYQISLPLNNSQIQNF